MWNIDIHYRVSQYDEFSLNICGFHFLKCSNQLSVCPVKGVISKYELKFHLPDQELSFELRNRLIFQSSGFRYSNIFLGQRLSEELIKPKFSFSGKVLAILYPVILPVQTL